MGTSQSKCSYCESKDGSSHSSSDCEYPSTCVCTCNVGGGHDFAQKCSAVLGGGLIAIGGVATIVMTGGAAGLVYGGAALGAGVSSAVNGITASVKGEKMNAASYFIDAGVGAVGGALTAGAGGTAMQCTKTTWKIAAGTALGAAAGGTSSAIEEGANVGKHRIDGDEDYNFNGRAVLVGAAGGALGGAAAGASGAIANKAANALGDNVKRGVTKAVTRAGTQAVVGAGDSAIKQGEKVAAGGSFDGYAILTGLVVAAAGSGISSASRNFDDQAAKISTKIQISRGAGKTTSRVVFGAFSGTAQAVIRSYGNGDDILSPYLLTDTMVGSADMVSQFRADKQRKARRVNRKDDRMLKESAKAQKKEAENK